jgi:hypothetical protein
MAGASELVGAGVARRWSGTDLAIALAVAFGTFVAQIAGWCRQATRSSLPAAGPPGTLPLDKRKDGQQPTGATDRPSL